MSSLIRVQEHDLRARYSRGAERPVLREG